MTDEDLRRALLRIAARESVGARPADARQRGAALPQRARRAAWFTERRSHAVIGALLTIAIAVALPLAFVLRDGDRRSRLDITNDPGTSVPMPSDPENDASTVPGSSTTAVEATTSTTVPAVPRPTLVPVATIAPVGRAPAGVAADPTSAMGVVIYACPIRRVEPGDRSAGSIQLAGLMPATRYMLHQCVATTSRRSTDCWTVAPLPVQTDANGNAGSPDPMRAGPPLPVYAGLRRYMLVGQDVVDCVDVQCEVRLDAVDDAGRVLDTATQRLVFADELLPEIRTEDLLQLRHGVASDAFVPVVPVSGDGPFAAAQVCARTTMGTSATAACALLDATIVSATSGEAHMRFWPSRWALAWYGADCATPGVCWIEMGVSGARAVTHPRPIVVRSDAEAPAIEVGPPGPWPDGARVAVTLRDLEPRRFGVLAYCLDQKRLQQVDDIGSGDGLHTGCVPLVELAPTALGDWPRSVETFDVTLPRTLVDRNGDAHDCAAVEGCRIVAYWGTETFFSSAVQTVAWFAAP